MALTFGFYDSVNGDRVYNAFQFSSFFDGILTDGIYKGVGAAFNVTAGEGLTVNVGTGRAWFNSTWFYNDSVYPITLPEADLTLNRIDSIIFVVDKVSRTNSIIYISGTPAANPVHPNLTNDSQHHEYRLADVYVAATATSITDNNITNYAGTSEIAWAGLTTMLLLFSEQLPKMDGNAAIGTERAFARGDHVHPKDTTKANLASPQFSGTPTAPTAATTTNTDQIATTKFVKNAIETKANLESPGFSGTPTAPTAATTTNTDQIATTKFVKNALASPSMTAPTANTAAVGTNNTQVATTAFVHANPRNKIYSASCSSARAVNDKVATILGSNVGFSLTAGIQVAVYFTYEHAFNMTNADIVVPTLNVNNTGAKQIVVPIYKSGNAGAVTSKYDTTGYYPRWGAKETVIFTYTGSYWLMSASSWLLTDAYSHALYAYENCWRTDIKESPNTILAGPASGTATGYTGYRQLVVDDIPSLPATKIGSGAVSVARGGTGLSTLTSGAALIGNGTGNVAFRSITNLTTNTSGSIPSGSTNLITSYTLQSMLNRRTPVSANDTGYTTIMARGIMLYPASNSSTYPVYYGAMSFAYA